MKLKIIGFEKEINLNNEEIVILEIRNTKLLTHIIQSINDKFNGNDSEEVFLLNEKNEEINIQKEIYMLLDLFNIEYNAKKIINKVYEIIKDNINKNQDLLLETKMFEIREYLIQEINELPFEFIMKPELDVLEILKLFCLKIDETMYESVLQKIETLIDLISTLKLATILIIPNLKCYLNEEEMIELYKYSLYNNIKLILMERNNFKKLQYEKIILIDEQFDEQVS